LSWELFWDHEKNEYVREDGSFASLLNDLIEEMSAIIPPAKYHDNEDVLAQYVIEKLNWDIKKVGNRWIGGDYQSILEQGGFNDLEERNLVQAATGRVVAAIDCKFRTILTPSFCFNLTPLFRSNLTPLYSC
jgi:hypothetical protein